MKMYRVELIIVVLALVATAIFAQDTCEDIGADPTTCSTRPECKYYTFGKWQKKTIKTPPKPIGCVTLPLAKCGMFWKQQYCQDPSVEGCTWTGTECALTSSITTAPTPEPTILEGCQLFPNAATCKSEPGCAMYNGVRVCNTKRTFCQTKDYGCQNATSFCAFSGLLLPQQCNKFKQTCIWDSTINRCLVAPVTTAPTTPPPTLAPTCTVATTIDDCNVMGVDCRWYRPFRACNNNRKNCKNFSYGCQSRQFCNFQGQNKEGQCKAFPECFFDATSNTCMPKPPTGAPTLLPTAFPTTSGPTQSPSRAPSRGPTVRPSHNPSRNPSRTPSRRPSRAPSRSPTTSRPSRTPSRAPSKTPSLVPTFSPSVTPSFSPTFSDCQMAIDKNQCTVLAGDIDRCEWVAPRVCDSKNRCQVITYGCKETGYCNLTLPGFPKLQCSQRQKYCIWNTTKALCEDPCLEAPPKGPFTRNMCAAVTYPNNVPSGRMIRFLGNTFLDHAGDGLAGNGDFDGDGKIDIAIGSPDTLPKMAGRLGTGSVNLILGSLGISTRTTSPRQTLLGDDQYRINGTYLEANFGARTTFLDLDGDGYDDLVVSAPFASPFDRTRGGQVYIFWGRPDFADAWTSGLYKDLENLPSDVVLRIPGEVELQVLGSDVSTAGDFDGDGFMDLIIGSSDAGPSGRSKAGQAYIVYGRNRTLFGNNPFNLKSSRVTKIIGRTALGYLGSSLYGGRDVNGDKFADVILGAPWAGIPAGTGSSFVVFGRSNPPEIIDLLTDNFMRDSKWNYLVLVGEATPNLLSKWSNFGRAVALLGDVNQDGIDDFAIGAPYYSPLTTVAESGRLYVFFGRKDPIESISRSDLLGYEGGFIVDGSGPSDLFGSSIAGGFVDFNGDGYADILTSSPQRTTTTPLGGQPTILYGRCTPFPDVLTIRGKTFTGAIGTHMSSERPGENFGSTVFAAGDIDKDGRTDLLIGAHYSDRERGAAYLIFSC